MSRTSWLTAAALLLCMTPLASASVTILQNSGIGNPDENVLFNGAGAVVGPGNLLTGRTNDNDWLLDYSSTDSIIGDAGGQAKISPNGSTSFSDLTVFNFRDPLSSAMLDILDFEFNILAKANGNMQIDVYDDSAGSNLVKTGIYALSKNGQNKFRITADGVSVFGRIVLTSLAGDNFTDFKQPRITGQPQSEVVPEPASLAVWGCIGFLGVPYGIYRRRKAVNV